MAEENKEVVEETTEKVVEKKEKQPRNKKGQFKKQEQLDENIIKVDLSKKSTEEKVEEQPTLQEITDVEEIK